MYFVWMNKHLSWIIFWHQIRLLELIFTLVLNVIIRNKIFLDKQFPFFYAPDISEPRVFSCNERLKKWQCHLVHSSVLHVSRDFQRKSKVFLTTFRECLKEISRTFSGSWRRVSRKFQVSFVEASWMCNECFNWVSRKLSASFKGVPRVFQRSSEDVSRKSQRCFTEVLESILREFQGCLKEFFSEGYLIKV